ncbi:hypothetical protein CFOL_v3_22645 [Cephalotus follicularis]|uniref:Uncharacterized protein n=1 Tax=Cephalotus follicularis TaxID=3775 RepID=A0A1Q3CG06_CEPFO|nr:hypothetical protein CFOL_v3_22645 [Cephalotus follicularis]
MAFCTIFTTKEKGFLINSPAVLTHSAPTIALPKYPFGNGSFSLVLASTLNISLVCWSGFIPSALLRALHSRAPSTVKLVQLSNDPPSIATFFSLASLPMSKWNDLYTIFSCWHRLSMFDMSLMFLNLSIRQPILGGFLDFITDLSRKGGFVRGIPLAVSAHELTNSIPDTPSTMEW